MDINQLKSDSELVEEYSYELRNEYKDDFLDDVSMTVGDLKGIMQDIPLPIDVYQKQTQWTAEYPTSMPDSAYCAIGFAEESGELLGHVKKMHRNDNGILTKERREKIVAEAGDVMYYYCALLNCLSISVSEVLQYNQVKLLDRLKRNVIKSEGDNR